MCTHIHAKNPYLHTDDMFLFIYHVRMQQMTVCVIFIQIVLQQEVTFINVYKNQS